MNPAIYVKCIYMKDKLIKHVNEVWVGLYLNKILIQNKKNAEIMEKVVDYCMYLSPTHYYYLLFLTIPRAVNYTYTSPKRKSKDDTEDVLITKAKQVLGWSNKEFELNKNEFEKTILTNRDYWESELAIEPTKKKGK